MRIRACAANLGHSPRLTVLVLSDPEFANVIIGTLSEAPVGGAGRCYFGRRAQSLRAVASCDFSFGELAVFNTQDTGNGAEDG